MTVSKSDISVVQNLYLLQVDLAEFLRSDLSDPEERRIAKQRMREFSSLLKQADWRYMGGEDVLDSLKEIQDQIADKINSARLANKTVAKLIKNTSKKKKAAFTKKIKKISPKKKSVTKKAAKKRK